MPQSVSSLPLRPLLAVDAATCGGMGLVLIVGAGFVAGLTGLPTALLLFAGIALLPIAVVMAIVASRPTPPPAGVWLILLGNVLWVVASVALLLSGWVTPNALGYAFVLAQAFIVAGLAWLEFAALSGTATRLRAS